MNQYTYPPADDHTDKVQEPAEAAAYATRRHKRSSHAPKPVLTDIIDDYDDVVKPGPDGLWHTSDGKAYKYMPGTPQSWEEAMRDLEESEQDFENGNWVTWEELMEGIEQIRRQYAEQDTHIA